MASFVSLFLITDSPLELNEIQAFQKLAGKLNSSKEVWVMIT